MSDEHPSSDDATVGMTEMAPRSMEDPVECVRPLLGGRYQILGLLGAGGMGSVYRVRDVELSEVVALKMLRRELVDAPGMLERFRREVKLARRVTHPNVARTFDIGEHDGEKFLTMEYIDGESLSAILARKKRLAVGRSLQLAEAICRGLAAAHGAGVVHRDLKPDNVMIEKTERVVITDFGVARSHAAEDATIGRTLGGVVGTPAYMAPEQVEGAPNVDARADIYALGVMLFEMLTGEMPWQGKSAFAIAAQRLTQPPPDARSRRPDIPPGVAEVVRECMARQPADRLQSAEDVISRLAAHGATLPGAGMGPASITPPSTSWHPPQPAAPTPPGDKTVAVLPFRNAGPPEDEYVADGITEDLIDTLSMTAGLKLRPRSAVTGYKRAERDAREIGAELGVQVVVEGSVRRAGEMVRLSARLVSVDDGFQLWAKRFDRPVGDLLVMSDEAAAAISEALTVDAAGPVREAPSDPRAIDLYLQARAEHRRLWRDAVGRSVELFRQALELAPNDPTILSGYARALVRLWFFTGDEQVGSEARQIAERALSAAPDRADAMVAMAGVDFTQGRMAAAARLLRKTLNRAPMNGDAHHLLGQILAEVGRPEQALKQLETADTIDPKLRAWFDMARTSALLGRWEAADRFLSRPQEDAESRISTLALRARIALWQGDPDAALALEPALEAAPAVEPIEYARLVAQVIKLGKVVPEHIEFMKQKLSLRRGRMVVLVLQVATEVLAYGGEVDLALDRLERAVDEGLFDATWLAHCPPLERLRAEPRFADARARVEARAAQVLDALGGR